MKIERWRIVASGLVALGGLGYLIWVIDDHIRRFGPSPHGVEGDWAEGIAFGMIPILAWVLILNVAYEVWKSRSRGC